jgi:hypothetical protein
MSTMSSHSKHIVKRKENPDGSLTTRPIKKTKSDIAAAAAATRAAAGSNTKNGTKAGKAHPSYCLSAPSSIPSDAPAAPKAKARTSKVTIVSEDQEEEEMAAAGIDEVIKVDFHGNERSRRPVYRSTSPSKASESAQSRSDNDNGSSPESGSDSEGSDEKETDEQQLGQSILQNNEIYTHYVVQSG